MCAPSYRLHYDPNQNLSQISPFPPLDPNEYDDHHPSVDESFWVIEISDMTLRKEIANKKALAVY